jgi:hypothetical protein
MIDLIRPDEVTQVEYFGLIHEESWEATYSIGRILDKRRRGKKRRWSIYADQTFGTSVSDDPGLSA